MQETATPAVSIVLVQMATNVKPLLPTRGGKSYGKIQRNKKYQKNRKFGIPTTRERRKTTKRKHLKNPKANTITDEAHQRATERNVNNTEEDEEEEEDAVDTVSADEEKEDDDKDFK